MRQGDYEMRAKKRMRVELEESIRRERGDWGSGPYRGGGRINDGAKEGPH